jgi:hypothetical protein
MGPIANKTEVATEAIMMVTKRVYPGTATAAHSILQNRAVAVITCRGLHPTATLKPNGRTTAIGLRATIRATIKAAKEMNMMNGISLQIYGPQTTTGEETHSLPQKANAQKQTNNKGEGQDIKSAEKQPNETT